MKLIDINKATYRKRANIVIGIFIASLIVISLSVSYSLIALYGQAPLEGSESTGNFRFNLAGVLVAVIICTGFLFKLKRHPFLAEVYYVWQLKQLTNRIYRKLKKVQLRADDDDSNAIICLKFYYTALRQIYLLDDNTLTLSSLEKNLEQLEQKALLLDLNLSSAPFPADWLSQLK